jgi:hypothetical protein
MPSTLDTVREASQVSLLPKLTAIEKDLQTFRAEVAQSKQDLRAEDIENHQEMRAEISGLRAEMNQNNQDLRADLELKFSMPVNEIQKIGLRAELTADKVKAETETYVHRSITPLAERFAVLEMSFRDLKEKLEKAS